VKNLQPHYRSAKIVVFSSRSVLILHALRFAPLQRRRKTSTQKIIALKLCKQEQPVEESELSRQGEPIFHTLINTCVENLILQKYVLSSSAQLLPAATSYF
jgi:hypothetical protein